MYNLMHLFVMVSIDSYCIVDVHLDLLREKSPRTKYAEESLTNCKKNVNPN